MHSGGVWQATMMEGPTADRVTPREGEVVKGATGLSLV